MTSYRIGSNTVDLARSMISSSTGEHRLEPKPMAVLASLIENAQQVVSRDDLARQVWPNVLVSDHALTRCISQLRSALSDGKKTASIIETLPKRGYRLVPPVTTFDPTNRRPRMSESAQAVAVLPFTNLSASGSNDYLAAGVTRDLSERLSLVPGLRVICSTSAERFTDVAADERNAAEVLGARYLVSGGVESRGERFRVRIDLIDALDRQQLWASRFDETMDAMFEWQDALVQRIARNLSSEIDVDVARIIESRGAFNLTAWEHMQLAEAARRNYNQKAALFIVENLRAALQAQPDNGVVNALLAMQLSQNLVSGWADDAAATVDEAQRLIATARSHAPNDARVLMAAGIMRLMQGQHAAAALLLERSLAINPNEPHALAELGMARYFESGDLALSLRMIEEAEASAPHHPRYSIWAYRRGICHYEAGNWQSAVTAYDEAIARMPGYHHIYFTKAVTQLRAGTHLEARKTLEQGLSLAPDYTAQMFASGARQFGFSLPDPLLEQFVEIWPPVS